MNQLIRFEPCSIAIYHSNFHYMHNLCDFKMKNKMDLNLPMKRNASVVMNLTSNVNVFNLQYFPNSQRTN